MLKIAQITDLHIGWEGEETYGVDVRQNFLSVLADLQTHKPDHLVVTGDLCYLDGRAGIYQWIKEKLDDTGLSYEVLSGNHDDPKILAEVFGLQSDLKDGELFYSRNWEDHHIIFLDTTTGVVSDAQLVWLEDQVAKLSGTALVFMHHPPLLAGVQFMDRNHPLHNGSAVRDILNSYGDIVHIFTGHYHAARSIQEKRLCVNITPACYFQINPFADDFAVDHYRIGYRWIEWTGEQFRHSVRYLG
ncbi:MAG: 3',5'-cyclic adenosine monophosphate phosphodiesterase CpdA [Nitrosomonas sp.]|nr:MAG: 3',5'-cyclic adenosine monophosphate phosphodiesterase CpdA [Nitrosomonas sp.]